MNAINETRNKLHDLVPLAAQALVDFERLHDRTPKDSADREALSDAYVQSFANVRATVEYIRLLHGEGWQ